MVPTIRLPLVVLTLLAAACHRQPWTSAASASAEIQAAQAGDPAKAHDEHAMTSIDAATGDLAGFANYAGGREFAPPPTHPGAALASAAVVPTLTLDPVAGSVASQPTVAAGTAPPGPAAAPTTETSAVPPPTP